MFGAILTNHSVFIFSFLFFFNFGCCVCASLIADGFLCSGWIDCTVERSPSDGCAHEKWSWQWRSKHHALTTWFSQVQCDRCVISVFVSLLEKMKNWQFNLSCKIGILDPFFYNPIWCSIVHYVICSKMSDLQMYFSVWHMDVCVQNGVCCYMALHSFLLITATGLCSRVVPKL